MSSFEDSNNPGYDHLIGSPAAQTKKQTVKTVKKTVDPLSDTSVPSFEESNRPGFDSMIMNSRAKSQKFKR